MVTEATIQSSRPTLGQRVLRINAIFSGLSGLLFVLAATLMAALTGISSPLVIGAVGAGLLLFAFLLYRMAAQPPTGRELLAIGILDMIWVASSALLLFSQWLPLTTTGFWLVVIQAEIVFWFGVVEFYAAWRSNRI